MAMNTTEAIGSGAKNIEKVILNEIETNPDYVAGPEYQAALELAGGDADTAAYICRYCYRHGTETIVPLSVRNNEIKKYF